MKQGTEWTEPGQGATLHFLFLAALDAAKDRAEFCNGIGAHLDAQAHISETDTRWDRRTNLALTGEPLNDYDLRRIATCK